MTIRNVPINPAFRQEERTRKIWERGITKPRSPVVVRGIVKFGFKKQHRCRLWTSTATLHVFWFMKRIPPGVRDGDKITIYGNLETANIGSVCLITDALIIPDGYTRMLSEISEVITRYLMNPQEYIEKSEVPDGSQERVDVRGTRTV